jgi:hypothetical protein
MERTTIHDTITFAVTGSGRYKRASSQEERR